VSIPIELSWSNTEPAHTAAAAENVTVDYANLRVYGLLTNSTKFEFYSYDPVEKQFSLDEEFSLETRRNYYCFGMIHEFLMQSRKL
jgi:hypothetical protein